jgi:predicted phosphodiesterase
MKTRLLALLVFGLGISLSTSADSAFQFEVDPYLFVHGTGHLALGWRYQAVGNAEPATATVQVLTAGAVSASATAKYDGISWSADLPIPECGFGSDVSYQVPGMPTPKTITETPCPGAGGTARFSFIADAQEGPEFLQEIADEISKFPGSMILSDGDLVEEGAQMYTWVDYFNALSSVGGTRVTAAARGNHEYRSSATTNYWQNYFRLQAHEGHYSVDIGDVHLIVLNSNFTDDPSQADYQLDWLKQELAKPAAWKVVMFHHSPYSIGMFDNIHAPKKEHLVLRAKYVPLFEAYGVDLVLTGHTHIFERSVKSGIQYIVAGPAGGKMGYPGADNPYSVLHAYKRTVTHVEATAHSLRATTLTIDGEIQDDLTLNK